LGFATLVHESFTNRYLYSIDASVAKALNPVKVAVTPAPAKCAEQVMKITITCVKGKLTKKVIAVSPKCPTGYKKK